MPVVKAVGVAVGHDGSDAGQKRAAQIREAMVQAVETAQAKGIADPSVIRQKALAARDNYLAQEADGPMIEAASASRFIEASIARAIRTAQRRGASAQEISHAIHEARDKAVTALDRLHKGAPQ